MLVERDKRMRPIAFVTPSWLVLTTGCAARFGMAAAGCGTGGRVQILVGKGCS